jgi:hypothetical protein
MTRPSRSSTALKRIGSTLIVVGLLFPSIMHLVGWDEGMPLVTLLVVTLFVMFPTISLGVFLSWRGRQYAVKADAERIVADSNPNVLYLRSFRSDPSVLSSVFNPSARSNWRTVEDQLAEALRPFGDLVAIGQPGERLPLPGAARIYASEEEWKEVVSRRMRAARLVVIRADVGENLLWELKQAVETLNPQKVLILVLSMKAEHYQSFCTKVNPLLGVSLPERATQQRFGRVSGFIGFATNWKPGFFPLRAPFFRKIGWKPYRALFKFALRPVFESFGLEWQPPPFWATKDVSEIIKGITASFKNTLRKSKK